MVSFSIKSGSKIGKCQLKIGKIWVKISRYWYNTYTIQWLSWHRIPMAYHIGIVRPWVPSKILVTEYPKLKNDFFVRSKLSKYFSQGRNYFFNYFYVPISSFILIFQIKKMERRQIKLIKFLWNKNLPKINVLWFLLVQKLLVRWFCKTKFNV